MTNYVFEYVEICKECNNKNLRTEFSKIYCSNCDDYTYRYEIDNDILYDTLYKYDNGDIVETIINTYYIPFKYDNYDSSEIKLLKYEHSNMTIYVINHLLQGSGCPCGYCNNYNDTEETNFIYFNEETAKKIFDIMKTTNYLHDNKNKINSDADSF